MAWPPSRNSDGGPASPAGIWRRAAALAVDVFLAVSASLALGSSLGYVFAQRAVVTLRIGEPGTLWQGPVPMMLGVVGEVVYLLPLMLWLSLLLEPITGATCGKRLLGLRVRDRSGVALPSRRAWRRHLVLASACWGWTLALVAGRWEIAVVASACGVVVSLGSLAALGSSRRALHDRLAGSSVRRWDVGVAGCGVRS